MVTRWTRDEAIAKAKDAWWRNEVRTFKDGTSMWTGRDDAGVWSVMFCAHSPAIDEVFAPDGQDESDEEFD